MEATPSSYLRNKPGKTPLAPISIENLSPRDGSAIYQSRRIMNVLSNPYEKVNRKSLTVTVLSDTFKF